MAPVVALIGDCIEMGELLARRLFSKRRLN
jgi:hypothetical protein